VLSILLRSLAAILVFLMLSAADVNASFSHIWLVPGTGIIWSPSIYDEGSAGTVGGIIGFEVADHWAVEVRVHDTYRGKKTEIYQLTHDEANLTWWLLPRNRVSPYLTAGVGIATGGIGVPRNDSFAGNGGAGLRVRLIDRISLRMDGRSVSYRGYGAKASGFDSELRFRRATELFGGISFSFPNGPRSDETPQ
jgi:hypothetical protein